MYTCVFANNWENVEKRFMNLKDIRDSIAVDMKDLKSAESISIEAILKYVLIRLIGIICFILGLAGIIFVLHYFGVSVKF